MATFTKKEVYSMATQIVSGLASNPAANIGSSSFNIEAAMTSVTEGVEQSITTAGHTITNDPFQSAVIDAANSS